MLEHCLSDCPDPELNGRTVAHQGAYLLGDAVMCGRQLRTLHGDDRLVGFDECVDATDVDGRLAVRTRHLPVQLRDDASRRADCSKRDIDGHPQRTEAVPVWRRYVKQGKVHRQLAALKEPWYFRKEHRREVGPSLLDGGAHVRADEERVVPYVPLHAGVDVRGGTLEVQ
jgi:hypothetical protein